MSVKKKRGGGTGEILLVDCNLIWKNAYKSLNYFHHQPTSAHCSGMWLKSLYSQYRHLITCLNYLISRRLLSNLPTFIIWYDYSKQPASHEKISTLGNNDGHDDVIKWKHFLRYWPLVRGIHRWPVNSPHKAQGCWALMFSLICALNTQLSKQSWGWWFEMPKRSLWRHSNGSWHELPITTSQNFTDLEMFIIL